MRRQCLSLSISATRRPPSLRLTRSLTRAKTVSARRLIRAKTVSSWAPAKFSLSHRLTYLAEDSHTLLRINGITRIKVQANFYLVLFLHLVWYIFELFNDFLQIRKELRDGRGIIQKLSSSMKS